MLGQALYCRLSVLVAALVLAACQARPLDATSPVQSDRTSTLDELPAASSYGYSSAVDPPAPSLPPPTTRWVAGEQVSYVDPAPGTTIADLGQEVRFLNQVSARHGFRPMTVPHAIGDAMAVCAGVYGTTFMFATGVPGQGNLMEMFIAFTAFSASAYARAGLSDAAADARYGAILEGFGRDIAANPDPTEHVWRVYTACQPMAAELRTLLSG